MRQMASVARRSLRGREKVDMATSSRGVEDGNVRSVLRSSTETNKEIPNVVHLGLRTDGLVIAQDREYGHAMVLGKWIISP